MEGKPLVRRKTQAGIAAGECGGSIWPHHDGSIWPHLVPSMTVGSGPTKSGIEEKEQFRAGAKSSRHTVPDDQGGATSRRPSGANSSRPSQAAWLELIRNLYAAHAQLTTAWAQAAAPAPREAAAAAARLEEAGAAWDEAIGVIDEARKKQMTAPGLQEPAKKALATLDREWDGLAAHRDYPMIGLDNNPAERALRRPVVTRKNACGSRNEDAARLAARIWTATATAQMAGLNVLTYLTAYLDECGRNHGKPFTGPDLERFLPWHADPRNLRARAQPPPPG